MKHYRLGLLFVGLALSGASCSVSLQAKHPDGGVFKSPNQGTTWEQAVFVSQTKDKLLTIGGLAIDQLLFSPVDTKTLYAVAREGALYETRNGGDQWQKIFNGQVQSVALHPKQHDVLYVASVNQLFRTTDDGKTWLNAYLEGTANDTVSDVAIDQQNPSVLYVGTSRGVVLRSADAGTTWQQFHHFEKQGIKRLRLNPKGGKIMYTILTSGGLFRTGDAGVTWVDELEQMRNQFQYSEVLKKIDPGSVRELVFLGTRPDGFLIATSYGLFRSLSGGSAWEPLKLVTTASAVTINALGVIPNNEQVIFYSADGAFYRTTDGGKTWQTVVLPAAHPLSSLAVQPPSGALLYLGFGH